MFNAKSEALETLLGWMGGYTGPDPDNFGCQYRVVLLDSDDESVTIRVDTVNHPFADETEVFQITVRAERVPSG